VFRAIVGNCHRVSKENGVRNYDSPAFLCRDDRGAGLNIFYIPLDASHADQIT
jgi:hypothetical protein